MLKRPKKQCNFKLSLHFEQSLNSCTLLTTIVYVEDLADSITVRMFKGDLHVPKVECQLSKQSNPNSVPETFTKYRSLDECYTFMCSQRERFNVLRYKPGTNGHEGAVAWKASEIYSLTVLLTFGQPPNCSTTLYSYNTSFRWLQNLQTTLKK